MSEPRPRLSDRHNLHTQQWIVQAATEEIEKHGIALLTNASIAERAGIAERTVYRHFGTREALMAAVATEVARRLATPPVPQDPAALRAYPALLYACFEAHPQLTREALRSDLFAHLRDGVASTRWRDLKAVLQAQWPAVPAQRREWCATNLRHLLTATTWHYHRSQLGLGAADTVAVVGHALGCILDSLGPPAAPERPDGAQRAGVRGRARAPRER